MKILNSTRRNIKIASSSLCRSLTNVKFHFTNTILNFNPHTTFPFSLKSQKNFHISHFRNFSSNENSNKINQILPLIEMSVYLREVDSLLNHIYETIDVMDLDTIENISLSDGVLRISFKKNKHYVINIQRPNLQVWVSSPFSGPQRFQYNLSEFKWENIRNKKSLLEILEEEFNNILVSENSNKKIKLTQVE